MNRIIVLFSCHLVLSGCATDQAGEPAHDSTATAPGQARTFVYECPDGFSFVVRTEADSAWLFLPGNTVDLPRLESGSDARYSKGGYLLQTSAAGATVVTNQGKHTACRNNRAKAIWEHAKLNGVDFRALGNEPGWYMEISNKTDILLVTDYGQHRYHFKSSTISPGPDDRTTNYKARNKSDSIRVNVSGTTCQDSMSGEQFSATVSVLVNGKRYTGCGKALH